MNRAHCIGVAASNTAIGPYTPQQHPLICLTETEVSEGRESIDPAPFLDDDGTLYLAWKLGGKMNKYLTRINLSKLSPDGLSVVGPTTELMTNDRNSWEGINVEAPFLMKRDGTYYLFYSGNLFQSSEYGVGYAVSRSIAGPYVKSVSNPILSSGPIVGYGPGEETIFRDGCGNDWLGFSDYDNPNEVGLPNERHFHAALLAWPQDGWAVHVDTAPNFSICNGTPKIPPAQINCKDVVLRFWGFDRGLYLYRAGWMQAAYTSSGNLMSGPPIAFEWRACPAHLF
jgi:beta-xylosidase